MTRRYIFENYWWVAILGAVFAVVLAFTAGQKASLVGSIIAATLGLCYFVLQQRLAEMRLFKELFVEFNRRYESLNERLLRAANSVAGQEGQDQLDRQVVIDYFNLCGEEYLFFREGYIHPRVWRSWCIAMLWYLNREPFRSMWEGDEEDTDTYYGLTRDEIERGAA
ncbi:MAG: hypothetical protein ABSD20_13785 [Terriglobales bacterium]